MPSVIDVDELGFVIRILVILIFRPSYLLFDRSYLSNSYIRMHISRAVIRIIQVPELDHCHNCAASQRNLPCEFMVGHLSNCQTVGGAMGLRGN